jgi:hypothetical protein
VLGYNSTYFSNKIQKGKTCYSKERTHWDADDLLKLCPSKGDKYVIDEELQHTDHLFLGVACFTFLNFELSIHLTKIMSAVKEGQQKYCETVYSRSGINHMWILKNSKEAFEVI